MVVQTRRNVFITNAKACVSGFVFAYHLGISISAFFSGCLKLLFCARKKFCASFSPQSICLYIERRERQCTYCICGKEFFFSLSYLVLKGLLLRDFFSLYEYACEPHSLLFYKGCLTSFFFLTFQNAAGMVLYDVLNGIGRSVFEWNENKNWSVEPNLHLFICFYLFHCLVMPLCWRMHECVHFGLLV